MAAARRSSRRRRKRKTSVTKNVVTFLRTYRKEVSGIVFLVLVLVAALIVYKRA